MPLPLAKSAILISMRIAGLGSAALSPTTIYQYALNAGFPPDTATKMVAIAMKESGGIPTAYNGTPPDDSYGLWQINMYGNLGPARMSQFGLSDKTQLFDPAVNATAAYSIWAGNDNNLNIAWAINDGGVNQSRYQSNLPVAQAAASAFGMGMPTDLPDLPSSPLDALSGVDPAVLAGVGLVLLAGVVIINR